MSCLVRDSKRRKVATFQDREQALLCLAALARCLRQSVFIRVSGRRGRPFINPLPNGCFYHDEDDRSVGKRIVARP